MLRRGWMLGVAVPAVVVTLMSWNVSFAQEKGDAKTIFDTASASRDHSTLVELIKLAGLDATLKEPGPYTLFGPTNAAFAKLDPKTLADLKLPANKERLTKILKNHVVKGDMKAADVTKAGKVTTLAGEEIKVTEKDGKVTIGTASVSKADLACSNGCIHVIDAVLMPAERK